MFGAQADLLAGNDEVLDVGSGLQDVAIGEGQVKVTANLQYEIENTGVKNLQVQLPAAADGVRFRFDTPWRRPGLA